MGWLWLLPALLRNNTQTTSVKCSQIRNPCTETTGTNISTPDNSWLTATSTNLRIGSEPESASTLGNAEVPDNAKVKAGATVMTPARRSTNEQPTNELRHS